MKNLMLFKNYGDYICLLSYRVWKWDESGSKLIGNHSKHEKKSIFNIWSIPFRK